MNKKSTFLTAVLMAAGSLTVAANAATVTSENWTAGKYYYLKAGDKYLSLCGTKADSVVVKTFEAYTKASRDSALWEITNVGTETAGAVYQFKNKKTQALLSFAKSKNAKPILSEGISKWTFKDNVISAYVSNDEEMKLSYSDATGIVFNNATGTALTVTKPGDAMELTPQDLGGGFSVFRLTFGGEYEGNIFEGKDLIATTDEEGYIKLQVAGDESYADGKKKYLGVDTLKTTISGATGAFGYKFSLDSIREEAGKENKAYKQFKFTADLMNDSLTIYVKDAPKATSENPLGKVRVVYAQFDNNLVLTVADVEGASTQGVAPLITFTKGTPAKIAGGTGVYFIKSAGKGETAGKYISAANPGIVTMDETPSVNHPKGQWYIKEEGGMYSIVDRLTNTALLLKGEVFAVQGMENTFTLGGNADSITVEPQNVDLEDCFLGSMHFTKEDMANHGYALNLIHSESETSGSYAVIADSILQIKSVEAENAFVFKFETVGEADIVGGAKDLGDTIYMENYMLKSQFSDKYVTYDNEKKSFKLSTEGTPFEFCFNTSADGGKYNIRVAGSVSDYKYISADMSSSNMILSNTPAYFKFVEMDAPEYGTLDTCHMRFTSDGKSLTMNTLTSFAEMKYEGQEILKSTYGNDNFSLKLLASDASTPERPLYYITTVIPNEETKAEAEGEDETEAVRTRYYMVSGKDSAATANKFVYENKYRVHFIASDTLVIKEDSTSNPALWALKIQESGDYLLENQQAANDNTGSVKYPYVGVVNNVVVMSATGIEFALEKTSAPVANEEIAAPEAIKVIGGHGELQILNAGGKRITISNILGQTITTRFLASDNEIVASARGMVIVTIDGNKAFKAIVK